MNIFKRYKKRLIFLGILLAVLITVLVIVLTRPRPVGGEIFTEDFKNGYDVYIRDDYYSYVKERLNQYGRAERYTVEDPHDFFRVSDESVKERIYELCCEIEVYRQDGDGIHMGVPDVSYSPIHLWMDAGNYGYRIAVYDWTGIKEGVPWSVFDELSEEDGVYVHFKRMDMSLNKEDVPIYEYRGDDFATVRTYVLSPSYSNMNINSSEDLYQGTSDYRWEDHTKLLDMTYGWWSVMPTETYDELRSLMETLADSDSELLGSYGGEETDG